MAKIVWSHRAQNDRKQILNYWNQRNRSIAYSRKLNQLFNEAVKIILDFPGIGKPTNDPNVRIKIVRDYLLLYESSEDKILILTIWDSRRNPDKLEEMLP